MTHPTPGSRASAAHAWSTQLSLQLRKKCHLLKLDLHILFMPLSFVFLPVYVPLVNISNAACSRTHARKKRKCHEDIIKIWRSAAKIMTVQYYLGTEPTTCTQKSKWWDCIVWACKRIPEVVGKSYWNRRTGNADTRSRPSRWLSIIWDFGGYSWRSLGVNRKQTNTQTELHSYIQTHTTISPSFAIWSAIYNCHCCIQLATIIAMT